MQINLPEEAEHQSVAAGYASVEQYIHSLVARDRERLAIQEGIQAMKQGQTEEFDAFDKNFRQENGLSK